MSLHINEWSSLKERYQTSKNVEIDIAISDLQMFGEKVWGKKFQEE